ncbi:MAG: hypothetical protein RMZ41_017520 [Nostoc sp. DedVER02]|uniref:hypothetical protein n=1 Tax=unclassified Nostoc TaxID=2593658 RepID=UPI002AD28E24|nr:MULTISPECIES: hypothetical protein [unclassified Nostoc]MDZ7985190.1 hypothetical protein [Nostoc sp. DedVER02]MDZ8115128.1 hypothetical protein [Nostoc sp. DedVER01b]
MAKAEGLTQRLISETDPEKRKEIIESNGAVWRNKALKKYLMNLSHGKCWYSEAREVYSHYHVDHFRPKSEALDLNGIDRGGYWWLAFDWANYRICGSVGNTKKGARFCVLKHKANCHTDLCEDEIIYYLDPIDKDDPFKLTFDKTGTAKPTSDDENDWDYKRAKYTIENLDLNYEPLKEGRKDLWDTCESKLNELQRLMKEYNQNPSASRKGQLQTKLEDLKDLTKPKSEFSAVAIECLLSSNLKWAQQVALAAA